jgi:hypothetical protein
MTKKVLRQVRMKDVLRMNIEWTIYKWGKIPHEITGYLQQGLSIEDAARMLGVQMPPIVHIHGNLGLNEGLGELIDIICGLGTPTKWDNGHAYLGVGDSNTGESASQTGLQAATNKTWKAMDGGYPSRSNQTAEWRATFGSSDANYAWEEYTVVNTADDSGKNLNRKCSSKGTKTSGETWTLSLKITFS